MQNNNLSSDCWTKIAFGSEIVTSYISDTYWFASVIDLGITYFSETPTSFLGLTPAGAGIGLGLATLSAVGSSYCHYKLNLSHQQTELASFEYGMINNGKEITTDRTPLAAKSRTALFLHQKLALAGDFLSHVGEYAGPITFVVALATQNKNPPIGKLLTQCGATLFGVFSSIADVRTCKNNLQEMNMQTSKKYTV